MIALCRRGRDGEAWGAGQLNSEGTETRTSEFALFTSSGACRVRFWCMAATDGRRLSASDSRGRVVRANAKTQKQTATTDAYLPKLPSRLNIRLHSRAPDLTACTHGIFIIERKRAPGGPASRGYARGSSPLCSAAPLIQNRGSFPERGPAKAHGITVGAVAGSNDPWAGAIAVSFTS
jgi:hypothetical protein